MPKTEARTDPAALAAEACHQPFRLAWDELREDLRRDALEVLRAGCERHAEIVTAVGLEDDAPKDWRTRSERLLEYRRTVDTELLEPLQSLFAQGGPAAIVERTIRAALDESARRCGALAQDVVAPWSEGALDRKPSDRPARRIGKVFARALSGARKAGVERTLPLRAVAVAHFDGVVVPGQDACACEALDAWAAWSHQLELAVAGWGGSALPALVTAELPDEDEDESWEAVCEAARTLQSDLEALFVEDPGVSAEERAKRDLDEARGALEADLAVAGSFLYEPDAQAPSSALDVLAKRASALRDWDQGVGARIRLYQGLLGILSGATAVQRRMVWRFRERCLAEISELPALAERLEALQAELARPGREQALGALLPELDKAVESALAPAARAIPQRGAVDSALLEISEATIEALLAMIRQAPVTLELHRAEVDVPPGGRSADRRSLPLQELARQSFDALRIERIRSATSGLADALDAARTDVSELAGVYSFARDEALRELESDESEARNQADDLVGGALKSISEALRSQVGKLDSALAEAERRLASEIADGSTALLDRVGAGRVEARLFAARSRMTDLRAWLFERWGPPVERARRRIEVSVARLRRFGARALRKGGAMVGTAPPATSSTRTLRALSFGRPLTERLPLVYQRLFTVEPISDEALLAGREMELGEAMRVWRRWRDAHGMPLVVCGRQGSGVTSFVNVLTAGIEGDGGSVKDGSLDVRIRDEARLACFLAQLLDLPPTDSLDQLSSALFEAERSSLPAAVALDNLEHLYLRVPGGTDLIERLLTLWAETKRRVFWIGGITTSAWQRVSTTEPNAVSQVDVSALRPLSAEAVRAALTMRHRRSGLTIRYEEPTGRKQLLRHRLRRLRRAEVVQSTLEDDFFDRLYKTSGGHLGLALFQWLTAADFESGDGVLMHPPERPDFSVLEALSLTQNFTLKALLEHRSLTLDEHDRIFRLPRQESYQLFESLRNRHLIEPLTSDGEEPEARSEIDADQRYRVRPLLTGAVISHLVARNIVH